MSTRPAPQNARLLPWLSIRHGRARLNRQRSAQLMHRSSSCDVAEDDPNKPLMRASTADQPVRSRSPPPKSLSRGVQIPIALAAPPHVSIIAVSLYGALSRRSFIWQQGGASFFLRQFLCSI